LTRIESSAETLHSAPLRLSGFRNPAF
jgi:hypothetical protein